jgi:hypothetical protein
MEKRTAIKIINAAGLMSLALFAVCWQPGVTAATKGPRTETVVDANGNLRVPVDYRTAYQFLGSWAVAADQGQGSKEIHVVYTSPGTIAAYRKDGRFPDGSVLVKEVFEATTGAMTTGNVSHAKILKGWFVMLKDSYCGRHLILAAGSSASRASGSKASPIRAS